MSVNLEITNVAINKSPTGSLTIGDDYAEQNTISFTIKLTGDGPVWLTLQMPFGEDGVLRQAEDANDLVVETPGTEPKPKLRDGEWSLGDYAKGIEVNGSPELSVSISNILCRASEGDSAITITADAEVASASKTLTVKKAKPTTPPENPILYFIAEPTYLIGSGEVTLRWAVAGDEGDVTLDTPTQKNWKPPASSTTDIAWKERPRGEKGSVVAYAIGTGVVACGDTLFTLITNRTGGPNWQIDSEMWTIGKSGIRETSDSWVKSSQQPEFPNNVPSTPHSIAAVSFKNRLYVRRLYRDDMHGEVVGAPLHVYVKS